MQALTSPNPEFPFLNLITGDSHRTEQNIRNFSCFAPKVFRVQVILFRCINSPDGPTVRWMTATSRIQWNGIARFENLPGLFSLDERYAILGMQFTLPTHP